MSRFLVVVTDDRHGSYDEEKQVLSQIDATLEVHDFKNDLEAVEVLRNADGVLVNLFPLGANVIARMTKCKVISRYGVGYDNVDVDAATRAGIQVTRVPDYCVEDVSDHALALLLGCVRKIAYKDRNIRSGRWNLDRDQPIYRIRGKVLGFVGFGAIARALKRKVSGLGLAKVLVYDPFLEPSSVKAEGAEQVTFDTLLRESDYISVHAPLSRETKGMLGEKEFSIMKKEVILINTSRGPIVNEDALIEALQSKRIAYAGLDVFEKEPLPEKSPLLKLDNVVLTDHSAWYSVEAMAELKTKAAQNLVDVLTGRKPTYPVNEVV